ncbi:phage integrase SAM-like domain-containing protein [uncultured Alistipes sp.]|uniref:phage integrase SAM-like domain-containing protein n=1 Tax=uncultured Alistipes sp. TaxID=538949 RepID=UPI00261A9E91|nr:phage integrase SAM-like domain-containing protein [uncultured Alistipes sp.]
MTVLQLIDARIDYFNNHEKFKNGKLVTSIGTASMYKQLRTSLSAFTQKQFNKDLSRFYFTDITQKFLLEYIVYLERRGIENGNRAGLRQLLRIFRALVNYAKDELHMYGANPTIFEAATEKMAWGQFESKAVNPNIIRRMEFMDRSLFTEQEQLCLDLFLFSFYSGGMANVDVVNLTWDMINEKEGMIVYERTKFPKLAKPLLIDRLIEILDKYRGKGIDNYVFPVYTEKHVTDKQKVGRRNSFSSLVSETLDKVCEILGIDEKMTWYTARGTFISSELDAGTPITHVAEMAGNSARTIEKHYYKNTKQEELRQRMNARYGSWGQQAM